MYKLDLEKAEEPEIKLPTSIGSQKKQNSRKTITSASWTMLKFVVIHPVKGFGVVNEAEVVFLEFSCFFYDPMDVGHLISGSSAFSKSSLYIWKFSVHLEVLCSSVVEA